MEIELIFKNLPTERSPNGFTGERYQIFFFGHTMWHVGSLVPRPEIEAMPPALGVQSFNH